jgi:hypothetical protein
MEQKRPEPEKDPAKDLQKFEQLPAKTKELSLLKDQAEKATGPENVALNRKIRDKGTPASGPAPRA